MKPDRSHKSLNFHKRGNLDIKHQATKEAAIVFPIADGVEDLEYYVTRMRLEEAGFKVLSAHRYTIEP